MTYLKDTCMATIVSIMIILINFVFICVFFFFPYVANTY